MPTPPRRRPAAGPPARRPRVAGLRRPTAEPTTPVEPREPAPPVEPEEQVASGEPVAPTEPEQRPSEPLPPADTRGEEPVTQAGKDPADQREDSEEPASVITDGILGADASQKSDEAHDIADEAADGAEEPAKPRPAPTGKRRSASRAAPADLRSAERSAGGPTRAKPAADPKRRTLDLAIALAVAALLCAALGLFFKGKADRLTSGVDQANTAFADPAATAEVKSKIISALERALSYDYRDLDKTAAAVREVLSGRAVCEYDAMFGQLRELAPAQKLVHTTIVRELGVRSLSGDRAEALVFIDQTSTRVEEDQTTASGAQLGVTAQRVDGQWKIVAFDTFDQPLPNGEPLPQC